MTSEAKRTLAAALEKIAAELAGASEDAKQRAEAKADEIGRTGEERGRFVLAFECGWMEQAVKQAAYAIRSTVSIYVTPPPRARGRR